MVEITVVGGSEKKKKIIERIFHAEAANNW